MRKIILAVLCYAVSHFACAQNSSDKVKVFLDCTRPWLCDFDYVRTEIRAVDFVRDRFVADVHILINTQESSSGGTQAELDFLGQKRFNNLNDTLIYFNDPTATEDEQRKRLVQYLKLGLTRFVAKTSYANQLQIQFGSPDVGDSSATPTKDPWNYWVFQFGADASLNGSRNYESRYLNGYFSANRETEEWKINFNTSINDQLETFIDDSSESKFKRKEYYSDFQLAKAINSHWSYGVSASYTNSLFSNIQAGFKVRPKIEYSLFPYSSFNSQRIVFQYLIGPVYNNYYDSTVFYKTEETQLLQSIHMITSFTKPWGSINIGVFFSNYFDDIGKNNLSFNGAVNWKIAKGLNFAIWGYYSLINDQIGLRKSAVSRDDLLTKNRELFSSFQYNLGFGFSYRFGSILNNIVNPRFRGLEYSVSL